RGAAVLSGRLALRPPGGWGVPGAVGVRTSGARSLPLAFCAGSRTFVCDNLAFSAEIVVARKHTRHGAARFHEAVAQAIRALHQYRDAEVARIRRLQHTELSADAADALLLRAYERQVLPAPLLPRVIREWRQPSFAEFQPRTLWALFNAFTTVLGGLQRTNPQRFAALTIRLHHLLGGAKGAVNELPTTPSA